MPAERAGYTVSMFLVDTSPTMANMRTVELPPGPDGEPRYTEITNLEWALRYVKFKIQEMIFSGRKTDQCGVIVFGSKVTDNIVNRIDGGYENVEEYIKIGQPNIGTLTKLDALTPTGSRGDPLDAIIVAAETQKQYLEKKKTWTRKIFLVTDGDGPLETEGWEQIAQNLKGFNVTLTVAGIDFDDEELGYEYPNKSHDKSRNERFYKKLIDSLEDNGLLGTMEYIMQEVAKPDVKQVRSALSGSVLRIGDPDLDSDEAISIMVKTSKCTSLTRPATLKKYTLREVEDEMVVDGDEDKQAAFAQLKMRTEYYVDRNVGNDDDEEEVKQEDDDDLLLEDGGVKGKQESWEKIEKEELVKGFKYGTSYAPCPDGQFPKLQTVKGIDILGFFPKKNFRRELAMGEIQYVWADPSSPQQQVALSSLVKAMKEGPGKDKEGNDVRRLEQYAIARWVTKDGADPKMGVLAPCEFEGIDCLLWARMPFADDVRKYTFASLDNLVNKKGEVITEHPYLPTEDQLEAMDDFVDAMDLGDAGPKDEDGNRTSWFSTEDSYNPAVHRVKQAIFHSAVVSDVIENPLPPPHPDLLLYLEPPKRVLKRAKDPLQKCKDTFDVKEVPKRVGKAKKAEHDYAPDEEDAPLLIHSERGAPSRTQSTLIAESSSQAASHGATKAEPVGNDSDTEDDDEELPLETTNKSAPPRGAPLPTPARSITPASRRGKAKDNRNDEDMDEDERIDPGRAPGRIIGNTDPLKDFKQNLATGDIVTKAVEDMAVVITEIVLKPFASRRTDELIGCMKEMRKTCLLEDEVDAWNAFVSELKKKCLAKPGNPTFWKKVQGVGRSLSYISDKEAKEFGGSSQYSEKQAEELVA